MGLSWEGPVFAGGLLVVLGICDPYVVPYV